MLQLKGWRIPQRCVPAARPTALLCAAVSDEDVHRVARFAERRIRPLLGEERAGRRLNSVFPDSRARTSDPDRQRQVSSWLAGCDKLGLMLLIASTMV